MITQRMTVRFAILFLLLGTTAAWSHRIHRPRSAVVPEEPAAESKISPRYHHEPKSSFFLDDHNHYPKVGGHDSEDGYVDDEEVKSHKEHDEAMGKEESDDTVKNDEYNDHSEKSGNTEFEAGGSSFDKHLKDHKADNKEVENVKGHDEGQKFGGEATKEHKLGKHKEKSKGHKLHGFKNVYHKEEYGDHKTFHDEFLDNDHQHNYDDHHEHQEVQGGKFSKAFKHEGKNKKYDKGDEKHEWGKEEHDSHGEGRREKGKQSSKHRHGSKKHQGQYDANSQRTKNSVHKVKKGDPPAYIPHVGHHGPHQAQIQPDVPHYTAHHVPAHVQSHHYKPHAHHQSHHVQFDDSDDKHTSNGDHGSHFHNHDGPHHHHHGGHQHGHGGHDDDVDSDEHFSQDDDDSEYQERTARKHKHRSHKKEQGRGEERLVPIPKHEPVVKHEPVAKHEPIVHRDELVVHRNVPVVSKPEPIAHKQSVSPNYGIHQYRQPVFQDSSHLKSPEPVRQDKYSHHPLNERSHDHHHSIRYGFQPRSHSHHHNHHQNHRFHQGHNSHHHPQQPFPRFAGFGHHQHDHGHRYHGLHKSHNPFRHSLSSYQQESKPAVHIPPKAAEHVSSMPARNGDHQRYSQKL